jgi:RNA-directed DNA polymerase
VSSFGSIHHGLLMEQVRRRVTDKRVLQLIRRFLAAGIMREHGSLTATPSGTPQGSGLSPLLANVALSVLDRHFQAAWTARTRPQRARDRAQGRPSYRMIRYADLCGSPHRSAYAESRVMPSGCRNACLAAGIGWKCSA